MEFKGYKSFFTAFLNRIFFYRSFLIFVKKKKILKFLKFTSNFVMRNQVTWYASDMKAPYGSTIYIMIMRHCNPKTSSAYSIIIV